MRDACRKIISFTSGRSRGALEEDELLAHALINLLEIIGEAASAVSPDTRAELEEVPSRKIIGMRNRLIHAYHEIDLEVVWDTATVFVPTLLRSLDSYEASRE